MNLVVWLLKKCNMDEIWRAQLLQTAILSGNEKGVFVVAVAVSHDFLQFAIETIHSRLKKLKNIVVAFDCVIIETQRFDWLISQVGDGVFSLTEETHFLHS